MKILLFFLLLNVAYAEECLETSLTPTIDNVNELARPLISDKCKDYGISDFSILDTPDKIHPNVLMYYRQQTPKLVDPVSDYHIIQFTDRAINQIKGKPKPISSEELARSKACAEVLFGLSDPTIELKYTDKDYYKASAKYESDKAMLESIISKYSEDQKKKIRDLFEAGKLEVESKVAPIDSREFASGLIRIIEEEEKNGVTLKQGGNTFGRSTLKKIAEHLLWTALNLLCQKHLLLWPAVKVVIL